MTPVAERLSDERIAEMLTLLDGKLPLSRADTPDYAEIDGPNWLQAMCLSPDALMLLNDVPSLLTELQHRRAAEAGKPNYPEIPEGWVLVPQAALDWLNGEAPDPAGMEFGEFTEEHPKPAGAFWWRKVFREIRDFYAAQRPPHAASPSSPATGVRVKVTAYELQVLIGTTICGCSMSPDRVFDLPAAWARLHKLGLIDRTDGIAVATPEGVAVVRSALGEQS